MTLNGKVALVTGASRNIGRSIATTFAAEGAHLVLSSLADEAALDATADTCRASGAAVETTLADVADPDQVAALVDRGLQRFGQIDVLVSVAAVRPHSPFWELSIDEWQRVLDVDLSGSFHLAKAVVPSMMERRGGSIIALGGMNAMRGSPGGAAVSAAKMGLLGLVRALAADLAPYGIRANMVVPGGIDTDRGYRNQYTRPGHVASNAPTPVPMGRLGEPEEIARACVFLASDASSYITGDRILCTGGGQIG